MTLADVKGVLPEKQKVWELGFTKDQKIKVNARNAIIDQLGKLDCFTLLEKLLEAGCAEVRVCPTCLGTQSNEEYFKATGDDCPDCRNGIQIKRKD